MLYHAFRPLLFSLDPETAHELTFTALRPIQWTLQHFYPNAAATDAILSQRLWGIHFPNPVGLAAGLDKNAELPHVWAALGFGFAELGTITARSQPGNPKPRLFRLRSDRALINRLGFNNRGATAVARELSARLARGRPPIPLGINIGKSRNAPVEKAVDDYIRSLRSFFQHADYVAVNVSSPNTPGLRDLQAAEQLAPLLSALRDENDRLAEKLHIEPRPILVKVAPDLAAADLRDVVAVAKRHHAAGIIATNTTVQRPTLKADSSLSAEAGGLSGAPLEDLSTTAIRVLYRSAGKGLPIIGVGGIFDADAAYRKIRAGAALVQLYTSLIYEGPGIAAEICAGLRKLLQRDGFANVSDAVGVDAHGFVA
jgi:dihydroorotate dehydrogenase